MTDSWIKWAPEEYWQVALICAFIGCPASENLLCSLTIIWDIWTVHLPPPLTLLELIDVSNSCDHFLVDTLFFHWTDVISFHMFSIQKFVAEAPYHCFAETNYQNYLWWQNQSVKFSLISCLKELRHGWCILEKIGQFFQVHRLQSILIFSILNQPCSCFVYYHLWCFYTLVNYYFVEAFIDLKVISHFAKMT